MIFKAFGGATALALLLSLNPVPASATQSATCAAGGAVAQAAATPKKKKGFGFGSILKAANQAGVGNMLTGGMLGAGKMGQVAGAVAGTAVNAADGSASPSGLAGQFGGLIGGHRVAQVAGAVTGTAANLARSGGDASQRSSGSAEAACASSAGPVVNAYK